MRAVIYCCVRSTLLSFCFALCASFSSSVSSASAHLPTVWRSRASCPSSASLPRSFALALSTARISSSAAPELALQEPRSVV
jgi:hypothetical protein